MAVGVDAQDQQQIFVGQSGSGEAAEILLGQPGQTIYDIIFHVRRVVRRHHIPVRLDGDAGLGMRKAQMVIVDGSKHARFVGLGAGRVGDVTQAILGRTLAAGMSERWNEHVDVAGSAKREVTVDRGSERDTFEGDGEKFPLV